MVRAALTIATLIALTATLFIATEQSHAQTVEVPPTLTMVLSGGSGTGTGDEGPDRLTRDKIDITVTSDEPLQEPPSITVVCNDITWRETVDGETVERGIDDFIANRTSHLTDVQPANLDYRCGEDEDNITLETHPMTATGATSWAYQWHNPNEAPYKLNDGLLTAVAHVRDQSDYQRIQDGATVHNYAAASANFTLDTVLKSPLERVGGEVVPLDGEKVYEVRPFVFIELSEATTVTLERFEVDGVSQLEDGLQELGDNEFLYWPDQSVLELGTHKVAVSAVDAANNAVTFNFQFEVAPLPPFMLQLQPGWNAVSVPRNPFERAIDAVLTDPAITTVVGWDNFDPDDPWHMAKRRDSGWEAMEQFGMVTGIDALYGYWVYSNEHIEQPVRLFPKLRAYVGRPCCPDTSITSYGWNFVGVVDKYGDEIEDHFGQNLMSTYGSPITASEYLGRHEIAYRWDAENQRYIELYPDDPIRIGEAIWVYYPEPDGP